MLADAVVQVAPAVGAGLELARALELELGLVRRAQVGRTAQEPRDVLGQDVEHLVRRVASGDTFGIGREYRQVAVPVGGELTLLHLLDFGGELRILRAILCEKIVPRRVRFRAAIADARREVLFHAVGNQELRVLGPAVGTLRELHFLRAERLAVRLRRVLPVRRAVADVRVEDDQRRAVLRLPEDGQRMLDALEVVGVADLQDVPAVAHESRRGVVGERDARVAFDRDVVVVVDPAQVVELQVARERRPPPPPHPP
jgi:hypothetical protein